MLWKVEINIRRKFGLGWVLCLSIFAIITNIIRASGHKLNNGQNDVVWILFWGEMEACVAVIANSMTAFRSLFIGRISQAGGSPQDKEPPTERRVRQRKRVPHVTLPTMPSATFSGLRSLMHADPFEDKETMESELTLDDSCVDEKRSLDTGSHRNAQSTPRVSTIPFLPQSNPCFKTTDHLQDWHERNISLHETSV